MKKPAIIIDMDGTLVDNTKRIEETLELRKKNLDNKKIRWDDIFKNTDTLDVPNPWCMEIVEAFSVRGYKIIFLTGRMGTKSTYEATQRWIDKYVPAGIDYQLIMRPEKDFRKNHEMKSDILNTQILPFYNVLFAIDDHSENANMMRAMGITCLHCADYTEPHH